MNLPKLHFITQPNANFTNEELVERVCKSGVRLIQLRIKNKPLTEIYEEAKIIKNICLKYNATFILNDYVYIVKELNIDGVHLGKSDLSPIIAREMLDKGTIIGGTANSLEDVQQLIKSKVDYIGLGPYKFTNTKKNLSPVLGLEGYHSIIKELDQNHPPIYAIGGIVEEDIKLLIEAGAYGVAISGLIANSRNIDHSISSIQTILS